MKLKIASSMILLFSLLFTPAYANNYFSEVEVDIGLVWGFWGDSMTDGVAPAGNVHSIPEATWSSWTLTTPSEYRDGVPGCSLAETAIRYGVYGNKANMTWVHVSEYGRTDAAGQTTAADYADTWEAMILDIHTDSPNAVISYEITFTFEDIYPREFYDWNVAMIERASELRGQGIRVYIADVETFIKKAEIAFTPADVWYPVGDTGERHFTGIGNLVAALTIWDSLGYDVTRFDLSTILESEVSTANKATIVALFDRNAMLDGAGNVALGKYLTDGSVPAYIR